MTDSFGVLDPTTYEPDPTTYEPGGFRREFNYVRPRSVHGEPQVVMFRLPSGPGLRRDIPFVEVIKSICSYVENTRTDHGIAATEGHGDTLPLSFTSPWNHWLNRALWEENQG